MGQPTVLTATLATADDDGIALSQTPGAAGDLTIAGALASGGVATLTSAGAERVVIITSAGNDTARTFTIYGTNASGNTVSQAIAGANGIASSTLFFRTVTRIAVDAATAGAVKAGTNGVGGTRWLVLDMYRAPFSVGIGADVSGTIDFTGQVTYDDPNVTAVPTPFAISALTTKSADTEGTITTPVFAVRMLVNSGTGTVAATVIQAGV